MGLEDICANRASLFGGLLVFAAGPLGNGAAERSHPRKFGQGLGTLVQNQEAGFNSNPRTFGGSPWYDGVEWCVDGR